MYWAFYDPQARRDVDWRGRIALEGDLSRRTKRSAPRTSEQILFVLDDADVVREGRPITVVH